MKTCFDLIIFDCDGVVVDSESITFRVFGEVLAEFGLELSLEQLYERFLGRSVQNGWEIVEQMLGRPVPTELVARYPEQRDKALREEVRPVDGIQTILENLETPYCIASNGDDTKMQATLSSAGLLGFFQGRLFSAMEVANAKPAPDVFLHAAEKMGARPSRTAVVEDTVAGVAAGYSAGMTVLGYTALFSSDQLKKAGAAMTFSQMNQLCSLLQEPPTTK